MNEDECVASTVYKREERGPPAYQHTCSNRNSSELGLLIVKKGYKLKKGVTSSMYSGGWEKVEERREEFEIKEF